MFEFQLDRIVFGFLAVAWIAYPILIAAVLVELRKSRKMVRGKILNFKIIPISEYLYLENLENSRRQAESNSMITNNMPQAINFVN